MMHRRSAPLWTTLATVVCLGACDNTPGLRDDGSPRRVVASPIDTGVYIGGTMVLHAVVYDREGNVLSDPVTWSPPVVGVTASNAGVVTGTAYGRYWVKATAPGQAVMDDSVRVNVVPRGRLLAVQGHTGGNALLAFDTDGSNLVGLTSTFRPGLGAWIPGTSSAVFEQGSSAPGAERVLSIFAGGATKPFLTTAPAIVPFQNQPAPSADGEWVYFAGQGSSCPGGTSCVMRARTDGAGLEVVIPTTSSEPSPSPDGSKVAYAEIPEYAEGTVGTIRVFDVGTKTASTWSVTGVYPAWSPDGAQIAYVTPSHTIALIAPDGTGARILPTTQAMGGAPQPIWALYGWSPDSKWLLTGGVLVEVATGLSIPVGYATGALITSMK